MDMTGEFRIAATRQRVWEALNDPEILRACIPGCESLDKLSETELTAKVKTALGPVKATFSGKVTLSDLDPPNGYRISGKGTGGAAGFAEAGATVTLEESGAETILRYTAQASVGGKLAQIGSRLIDSTAKKLAGEFFAAFAERVGTGPASDGEAAPAETNGALADASGTAPMTTADTAAPIQGEPVAAPPKSAAARQAGLSPAVWVPALVVIVGIILYFATR